MFSSVASTINGLDGRISHGTADGLRRLLARRPESADQDDPTDAVDGNAPSDLASTRKTFRVFVLGASGSGKTTFLASLYNRLSVQQPDTGFYLEVSEQQRKTLVRKYQQISDPSRDWPAGTLRSEVTEWFFTCAHAGESSPARVFTFSYVDYAGEKITEPTTSQEWEPGIEIRKADSILVLLDGQKILRFMNGETESWLDCLNFDLDHLVAILAPEITTKPVHFAITKWDIVEQHYTLAEIRSRLLQLDKFKALVDQRRARRLPIRLIPMSALGRGFATLDDDGVMMKRPDASPPKPYHVEMSIACALIDGFHEAANGIPERERQIHLSWRQFLSVPLGLGRLAVFISRFFIGSVPFNLSNAGIAVILSAIDDKLKQSEEDLKRQLQESLSKIRNEADAVQAIILNTCILVKKLDAEFPESDLLQSQI